MKNCLFTSESVSEGHPDKMADQISDSILDAILEDDPTGRVACEVMCSNNMVVVSGEITTTARVDYHKIVTNTIRLIGYTDPEYGLDYRQCKVEICLNTQSPDIAQGVRKESGFAQGAGDQGLMFGYACDETDVLMPAPIYYAHRLMKRQSELRRDGRLPWLRPDAKSQISMRYNSQGRPQAIECVVLSTQHAPDVDIKTIREGVIEEIIKPMLPTHLCPTPPRILINPTGRFVVGGPQGDCGLTGRKIIVDTYGGYARHGGGAFSGKDPSKVDRSACYAARYVAKNIVAAGLARHCEVQIAYAIGVAEPVSFMVDTYGTGKIPDEDIVTLAQQNFDLRPRAIIEQLNLLRPIYQATAAYGHFGRDEPNFTWESLALSQTFKTGAGMFQAISA